MGTGSDARNEKREQKKKEKKRKKRRKKVPGRVAWPFSAAAGARWRHRRWAPSNSSPLAVPGWFTSSRLMGRDGGVTSPAGNERNLTDSTHAMA